MRHDGRQHDELRPITFDLDFITHPEGSVLITAEIRRSSVMHLWKTGCRHFTRRRKGWITAEYSMLPRATNQRTIRESSKGKVSGRTMEIQRLIGRALRAVVDLEKLGERTIWIDCDVIQADGGTRTASITGAFLAMAIAIGKLVKAALSKPLL